MIVNYLKNVLHRQPDLTKDCSAFAASIKQEPLELQNYMYLACQYNIMGINPDKTPIPDFMPNQYVTRADFGTILSRILRGDKYEGATPYYVTHLQALKEHGIITQIDSPEQRKELRKRVRLMLMRSAKGETSSTKPSTALPEVYVWAYAMKLVNSPIYSDVTLTRGHFAQMVVNYALNVLGRTLPEKLPASCYRKDGGNAWETAEQKDYAKKACQLGLMGMDMDYFQSYTKVTQAQMAIVLYRVLYDPTYIGKQAPREMPLEKLTTEGMIEKLQNPREEVVPEDVVLSILMKERNRK
jgi:hypothetical protein